MSENGRQRLTSWKEIAAHLGRDVRTVMRWEKNLRLPVHRVGPSRRVLFAYADELDAWFHAGNTQDADAWEPDTTGQVVPLASGTDRRPIRWLVAGTGVAVLLVTGWSVGFTHAGQGPLAIRVTEEAVVATDAAGVERWRHAFPATLRVVPLSRRTNSGADPAPPREPGFFVGYSNTVGREAPVIGSGQVLWLSAEGAVRRTFAFEDRLTFASESYGPPWGLTDYQVDKLEGTWQIAIAAHHYEWWPSLVTVLDDRWNRRGTFVNAGWVESIHWTARDRLVIAGFSNALDGGMIGLLDARALEGQSPAAGDAALRCQACGQNGPLRYIVLPRSEINRALAAPFNRVSIEIAGDRIVARTIEVPWSSPEGAVDVLYEFTAALDLVRATYSDRYWEVHKELEAQEKITHTRNQCPDRNGPRGYQMWEPGTGWRTVPIAPSHEPSSPARTRQ